MGPVSRCTFNLAKSIDSISSIAFRVRHKNAAFLKPVAESIHFGVDEERRQMLDGNAVLRVLYTKGLRKALHENLKSTSKFKTIFFRRFFTTIRKKRDAEWRASFLTLSELLLN